MTHPQVDEIFIVQLNGCPVSAYWSYTEARLKEVELLQEHQDEARVELIKLPVVRR